MVSARLRTMPRASRFLRDVPPTLPVVALVSVLSCSGDGTGPGNLSKWALISAGNAYTCALTRAGTAYCWGANPSGQLGDGTTVPRSAPTPVAGGLAFTDLATTWDHSCGVVAAGAAYCWGTNTYGQLGDGSTSSRASPAAVGGGLVFQSVAPGEFHTCGITASGTAYCWGSNAYGQLGDGTTTDRLTPTPVAGGIAFRSISTGDWHSCGLTAAGAAYCWGRNGNGQLGDSSTADHLTPARVAGGLTFQSLALGFAHSCGVTATGIGYCWGEYCCGQLGVGMVPMNQIVSTPARIVGGLILRTITAFAEHTCGVTASGAAYCWGSDTGNLLGTGVLGYYVAEPTAVVGAPPLQSLKTGATHTCGLTSNGDAYCWGLPNDPVGVSLSVAAPCSSAGGRPGPQP